MDDQNRIIAGLILNCKPEDLKGVAIKADGSLAVVAPNGMKFVFSPVELDNARDSFCLPANPVAEPVEASGLAPRNPHTSTCSVSGSGSVAGLSSVSGGSSVAENPMAEPVEAMSLSALQSAICCAGRCRSHRPRQARATKSSIPAPKIHGAALTWARTV